MKKLLLIPVLTLAVLGLKCGPGGSWSREAEKNMSGIGIGKHYSDPRPHRLTTSQGAIIESVVPVPQAALDALDRGFQRQIDRFGVMFPFWTAARSIAGTTVIFVHPNSVLQPNGQMTGPCKLESIPGAPCLYVGGQKSAGTVLGTHRSWEHINLRPPLVLPHQGEGNWQWLEYLEAAAHNEREHHGGWLNVNNEPKNVFYHFLGARDIHPWQWGETPVPYGSDVIEATGELKFRPAFVMPDEANHCMPNPTKEQLKKLSEELGISVEDLTKFSLPQKP